MAENQGKAAVTKKSPGFAKTVNYLLTIQDIDEMINEKQLQLDELRALAGGFRGIRYDGDRVQSSPVDLLGNTIVKIVELTREIDSDIDRFVDWKRKIMREVDSGVYNLRGRAILYKRYFRYMSVNSICREMKISTKAYYRLHDDAIRNLRRKLEKRRKR